MKRRIGLAGERAEVSRAGRVALLLGALLISGCSGMVATGAPLTNCLRECNGNPTCELVCRKDFSPDEEGPID